MVSYYPKRTYFVACCGDKVLFLGTDLAMVMERFKDGRASVLHRISAKSYKEAAMCIAESHCLIVNNEVQENFKLLRGYKPDIGDSQ